MSKPYGILPNSPTIEVKPFEVDIQQKQIDDLKRRLEDTPTPRTTFENTTTDEQVGIKKDWLVGAVNEWKAYDWRKTEDHINSFANYKAKVDHNGDTFEVHFVGLFSEKKDARPIIMTHGWPGSFLEFLPMLDLLKEKYTPQELPVHVVIPSLIGYGFSSPPPIDKDFTTSSNAALFDKVMTGLGFSKYAAQGGDIGSFVSRSLSQKPACHAIHLNFLPSAKPSDESAASKLDDVDQKCVERSEFYGQYEFAYKEEHATKTATISMICESSPVALLAWIGEKFHVWTDVTPPNSTILDDVSLYWLTNTFATSLYHYRTSYGKRATKETQPPKVLDKPVGYSQFPKEILPSPKSWAAAQNNVVWHRRHDKGGHFAALEQPELLWQDVSDFLDQVWEDKPGSSAL